VAKKKQTKKKKKAARKASRAKKSTRTTKKNRVSKAKAVSKTRKVKKAGKKRSSRAKKPKSPLTRAQLKQFRQLLYEKRRSLVGDMTGMQDEAFHTGQYQGSRDLSRMPDHPANIATDNYEQEFMLGLLENERELLREIDQALERMDEGIYGICLGTGKPIGLPRLKARPWAKYSIEYARMLEQGQVRPGDGVLEEDQEEED